MYVTDTLKSEGTIMHNGLPPAQPSVGCRIKFTVNLRPADDVGPEARESTAWMTDEMINMIVDDIREWLEDERSECEGMVVTSWGPYVEG